MLFAVLHWQGPGAGLVAAVMIAIVPGYISRSVAGSYDNEGKSEWMWKGRVIINLKFEGVENIWYKIYIKVVC